MFTFSKIPLKIESKVLDGYSEKEFWWAADKDSQNFWKPFNENFATQYVTSVLKAFECEFLINSSSRR